MKASVANYRQSPRKTRLITDLVKGKSVTEALTMLNKYKEVIEYVEQPLSRKDFEFNLMLRDVTDIPLMADESLMGEEDIDRIINQRAFEYSALISTLIAGLLLFIPR